MMLRITDNPAHAQRTHHLLVELQPSALAVHVDTLISLCSVWSCPAAWREIPEWLECDTDRWER